MTHVINKFVSKQHFKVVIKKILNVNIINENSENQIVGQDSTILFPTLYQRMYIKHPCAHLSKST